MLQASGGSGVGSGEEATSPDWGDEDLETGSAQTEESEACEEEEGSSEAESWSRAGSYWQSGGRGATRGGGAEEVSTNPNSGASQLRVSSSREPNRRGMDGAGKGEKRSLDPSSDEWSGTGSARRKVESGGAWTTAAWSGRNSSWGQSGWHAPYKKWQCSGWSQWPALRPAKLPKGDRRFARRKLDREGPDKSRVYVCDSCLSKKSWWKKSLQFDGQYVNVLAVRGRSVEELEEAYYAGEVDATWLCSRCHQRKTETLFDCRVRLGLYDTERMERTRRLFPGWRFKRSRHPTWQ